MFYIREIMGWGLMACSGWCIYYAYFVLLKQPIPRVIASVMLTVVALVVFRGAIHLLKTSVAARLAKLPPEMHANTGYRPAPKVEKSRKPVIPGKVARS